MVYRVIVADDEPQFRRWLRLLLESSKDFQVVGEAITVGATLDLIASLIPDLVIADIYMPDADGLEVARYVERHYPAVRVILVSAQEERIFEQLARQEGALAFIPKLKLSLDALRQILQGVKQP